MPIDRKKMLLAIGVGEPEPAKDDYPEFAAPDGMDVTDLGEGEEKEVVAKIKKKPDGMLCLVAINNIPLGKGDEPEPEDNPEEESEETQADDEGDNMAAPQGNSIGDKARNMGLM